ncbi:MAG: TldD/PmbA family protein [Bacilli bacterium]|nr:TldD/PmbA family protein [Bacilli bacterium]
MKYDKFFLLAKEKGISEAEISICSGSSLSFSLFHGEIDNFESSNSSSYLLRGIYNGKMGSVVSDIYSNSLVEQFVNTIIESAKTIENNDEVFIYKGDKKYKRINVYNKQLESISIEKKINDLHLLEDKIKKTDSRISEVESVSYGEDSSSFVLMNSHGLKLHTKSNSFYFYGGAVAKKDKQVKTGGDVFFDNDYSKFNIDDFAKNIVNEAVSQLDGEPCESGQYKAVLDREVVSSLTKAYISSAIAESVQKKSSLFIGKLGEKIASKHVNISDNPLKSSLFARSFDDEGVATKNTEIIKNGILKTYLYNLTTAKKDGVNSTGHGTVNGSKVGTTTWFLEMKPGKKSLDELFNIIGDGVYITSVQGLHAGLNAMSGNFSLQANGFLIKNGKKVRSLDIITISGNLIDVFKDITYVGNDSKIFSRGIKVPSVVIKKIVVSGK